MRETFRLDDNRSGPTLKFWGKLDRNPFHWAK